MRFSVENFDRVVESLFFFQRRVQLRSQLLEWLELPPQCVVATQYLPDICSQPSFVTCGSDGRPSRDVAFVVHTLMQDTNDVDTGCRMSIEQDV
jgi:hypothetical protein